MYAVCRVLEGCGLSVWGNSGLSDPYCQVLLLGNGPGIRSEVKRGPVHKRTVNPKFNDYFDFPVSLISFLSMSSIFILYLQQINSMKDFRNTIVR